VRDSLPAIVFLALVSLAVALAIPKSTPREVISTENVHRLGTLSRLAGSAQDLSGVSFSADNHFLASGSVDGTARIWNIALALTSGYKNPDLGAASRVLQVADSMVTSLAFSPDADTLAAASADGTVSLWHVKTGERLQDIPAHTGVAASVAFSPDGKTLASAGYDSAARLWDAETGAEVGALAGHTGPVLLVKYSPDGSTIATASLDGSIRLWDAATYEPLGTLDAQAVQGMNFSPDGSLLGAVSRIPAETTDDGETLWGVQLWSITHDSTLAVEALPTVETPTGPIYDLAFSRDDSLLMLAESDASLRFINLETGEEITQRWDHSDQVIGLALSSDGTLLASASLDDTAKLWKVMPE